MRRGIHRECRHVEEGISLDGAAVGALVVGDGAVFHRGLEIGALRMQQDTAQIGTLLKSRSLGQPRGSRFKGEATAPSACV